MLFYERVNPVAIETKPSSDSEIASNSVETPATKITDELTPVIDQSEVDVWDDNERHVRTQHLFDKEYASFLLRSLVSYVDGRGAIDRSESAEMRNEEMTASPEDSFLMSCIDHFLDVVLHGVEKTTFSKWTQTLKRGLRESPGVSRWFLRQLLLQQWWCNENLDE